MFLSVAGRQESTMADKRLSVERIYQKKSQLEHILLRPDTYIGSVQVGTFHLGCRRNSIFRPGCVRNLGKPSKKNNSNCKLFPKGGGVDPKIYIFEILNY